uniref:Ammonium transporter n=1 Tax=Haptolina brevifila TaxID=156173 RepID=A0A7S2DZY3_9EUKA
MSTTQIASLELVVAQQTQLIADQAATIANIKAETDTFYVFWAATLVFLMQCGFAVLAAGSVREKNVRNILLKNGLDACVGCIVWFLVGYGLATTSEDGNRFIGNDRAKFALSGLNDRGTTNEAGYDWISFFFSYTFAAAAATIVSGAVAERCKLSAYIIYTCVITGFIYPCVVHWVWDTSGFLSAVNPNHVLGGVIDFAGSGVVHMTGGIASFVAAKILGPRRGRWENPKEFEGHSTPLQILGTFLLWFGWYGFNGGSTLVLHGQANTMARVAVTTTISGAVSGCSGVLLKRFLPTALGGSHVFDVGHTCNSILGGLVGVTAGCATFSPGAAFACGIVSSIFYHAGSCTSRKLKIDDPLDAFAVHGACGFWGVIAVGLFTLKPYSYAPHVSHEIYGGINGSHDGGIFTGETNGSLFYSQLVCAIIEVGWVASCSTVLFGGLHLLGLLRVNAADEAMGLDNSKHGGSAYRVDRPIEATQPVKVGTATV